MTRKDETGRCLCGAVSFTATEVPTKFGACHCEMCRRWVGGAFLGVSVPSENLTWTGEDRIGRTQSSSWAERAWCRDCGSALFFRVTDDSEWSGVTEIPVGLFDKPDSFTMTSEIYIDHKPDSYAFAGDDRKVLTRDECVAKFAKLDSE